MYLNYYGFREKPFSEIPDPEFLYLSRGHREALAFLEYQIMDGRGFSVLIGEVGTGKTTLCKALRGRLDSERITLIHLCFSDLEFEGFLAEVLEEMGGVPTSFQKRELLKDLKDRLFEARRQGRRLVLLIDEAQQLSLAVLEGLRMLSNLEDGKEKVLQLVFVGQPSFWERLNRPDLQQLRQRLAGRFHLTPLTRPETHDYIETRLNKVQTEGRVCFTPEAKDWVWYFSRGVPRVINLLCHESLAHAFQADSFQVHPYFVQQAYRRLEGKIIFGPFHEGGAERASGERAPDAVSAHLTSTQEGSEEGDVVSKGGFRRKGTIRGWVIAGLSMLVVFLDIFFLFSGKEKKPADLSESYRQEIALPRFEEGRERSEAEKSPLLSFSRSIEPVSYPSQRVEDPF